MQKYGHRSQYRVLEISEIFLVAFCGKLDDTIAECTYGDEQHVDQCALKEQFKSKNTRIQYIFQITTCFIVDSATHMATVSDKQGWTVTSVPVVGGSSTAMLDGIKTGGIQDGSVFATPTSDNSKSQEHPWVQVDFALEKVVKGVHLYRYLGHQQPS